MRAYALPAAVPAVIALPAVRAYRRPAARRAQRPPTTVRTRASACAPLTPPLTIDAAQSARTPPRAVLAKRGTAAIPTLRDPATVRRAYPLPAAVPAGVSLASVGAYRAAAAVLASVSQPTVLADGFPAAVHAGGAPAAVGAYPGPIAALRARLALAIVLAHRDSAALDAQVPVTTVRTGAARLALGPPSRPVLASPVARAPLPLRRPLLPGVLAREGQERVSDPKLEDILEVRPPSGGHPSTRPRRDRDASVMDPDRVSDIFIRARFAIRFRRRRALDGTR